MCEWGNSVEVEVLVPSDLSHTDEARLAIKKIDRCIAPIVRAFQQAGINMRSSCCGHSKGPGEIVLSDGRLLTIGVSENV